MKLQIYSVERSVLHKNADEFLASSQMEKSETDVKPDSESPRIGEFKSTVNLILTAVGVGVLALPKAIAQSGWAIGVLLLLVTWSLSQFMMHLLWKCIESEKRRGGIVIKSYGSLGQAALGNAGRYMVSFAMYLGLSAICVIILILLGQGLFLLTGTLSMAAWIRIAALCILPLSWLPTLKEVGVLSAVGVMAVCIVGVVVVIASIAMDADERGEISAVPTSAAGLAMSFIEFMNSFTVAPVIPTIIVGMKDSSKYPRVAAYGFGIISLAFALIGFAGYAGWGSALLSKDGGNITSLIAQSGNQTLSTICQVSIIVVSLSHFLVMFNPVGLLMDAAVGLIPVEHKIGKPGLKILGRSCVVGVLLLMALYVPSFGTIVDLVGSTVVLPLQVIFPIIFYSILCKDELTAMSSAKRGSVQAVFGVVIAVALASMGYGLYNVISNW